MKTTIITALLLLAMASGAVGQEKWEYAILQYRSFNLDKPKIIINHHDKIEEITIENGEYESALIKEVNKLAQEGWEVYNTTDFFHDFLVRGVTYYLKRKKQ